MRGMLTDKIQEKAVLFLNREITQKEEIKILNKLYDEKHIVYYPDKIIVTRKFYNYIQDILATGYVEEFIRNE